MVRCSAGNRLVNGFARVKAACTQLQLTAQQYRRKTCTLAQVLIELTVKQRPRELLL